MYCAVLYGSDVCMNRYKSAVELQKNINQSINQSKPSSVRSRLKTIVLFIELEYLFIYSRFDLRFNGTVPKGAQNSGRALKNILICSCSVKNATRRYRYFRLVA